MTVLGILHPGSMGAAVAGQARLHGAEVLWCPAGRSIPSRQRALQHGLLEVPALGAMTERADVILSLCPPAAAVNVARSVAAHSYSGIYVDGNAVAPATMEQIGSIVAAVGATVIDGSIIGSPPSSTKDTRLYLSGSPEALPVVSQLFRQSAVRVHTLPGGLGQASALKLSYSSYQKASRILAAVAYALASDYGVETELLDVAKGRTTGYLGESAYFPKVAARAWRWAPEMEEVARALEGAGLPPDLAAASAAIMSRWSSQKDACLDIHEALALLHDPTD